MLRNCLGMFAILACLAGCTSFRTMALYRFDNDSVVPECNNEKLKGLPVKLKVPSHVRVTIYEQQVILANSPETQIVLDGAVDQSGADVKALKTTIAQFRAALIVATNEQTSAIAAQTAAQTRFNVATPGSAEQVSAQFALDRANERKAAADNAFNAAKTNSDTIPAKQAELVIAQAVLAEDLQNASVGYTLVSFKPAQLIVETQLDYTDKVFLVDFKRPAAGVLDLTEASMDDEQYFSKVQAEVEERTIQDVNAAITTLKGPLTASKPTKATPTSADSTGTDQSMEVNFQMSVIATQRFDISEPDWEARMTSFVDSRLHTSDGSVADAVDEVPDAVTSAE